MDKPLSNARLAEIRTGLDLGDGTWPDGVVEELLAELERLRAELAEVVEARTILRQDVDDLHEQSTERLRRAEKAEAERDALIDEVKTLQQDVEEFGEAQKAWLRFRRERDALKAAMRALIARWEEGVTSLHAANEEEAVAAMRQLRAVAADTYSQCVRSLHDALATPTPTEETV